MSLDVKPLAMKDGVSSDAQEGNFLSFNTLCNVLYLTERLIFYLTPLGLFQLGDVFLDFSMFLIYCLILTHARSAR